MQFPFGPTLWYKPWWKILFIEWPIIKREVAICKFVSFFFLAKLELQCACPLFFPQNKIIDFLSLLFANLSAFSFLDTWRFACASLLILTHSHPFLWVPQKMWSHLHKKWKQNLPDNCTYCFELAQAFLCLPPTQRSKHTQEKFIPESKLC